jgi:hypothetical protein
MSQSQRTVANFNKYRQGTGSWWNPYDGYKLFGGKTSSGVAYEIVIGFDDATLDVVRAFPNWTGVQIDVARFADGQGATETWQMAICSNSTGTVVAGTTSSVQLDINASMAFGLNSAQEQAIRDGNNYVKFWGATNGTYAGIYAYQTADDQDRPSITVHYNQYPSLTDPSLSAQGTVNDNPHTFDWGDSSDNNGVFSSGQLAYDLAVSFDNGSSWNYLETPAGESYKSVDLRALLGLSANYYYYNPNMKIAVRAKTPLYLGAVYYSNWVYSNTFTLDYRSVPANPSVPSITGIPVITADSYTFDWSNSGDYNGTPCTISYEFKLALDGVNYGSVYSPSGSEQAINFRTYIGLQAKQYYHNTAAKIAVRAKAVYNGGTYYSDWAVSSAFTIDYRIVPTAPASLVPSKANPYEGETISFDVGRPANYNTHTQAGAVNAFDYRVELASDGTTLINGSEPSTTSVKTLTPYVVGNKTSGLSDLSTTLRAKVIDSMGQVGALLSGIAFTIKRFRAPVVTVSQCPRLSESSCRVYVVLSDTGFGTQDIANQIQKIQYNHDGSWHDATLNGDWDGLLNSFDISGLSSDARYDLYVRAINVSPVAELSNKTGSEYLSYILEYLPGFWVWRDSAAIGNQASTGAWAQALIVGNDPEAPVDAGWLAVQNGIKASDAIFRKDALNNDLGGVLHLEKATNSTLGGNIAFQNYQNSLSFLESGGSYRGAYIDFTKCGSQSKIWHEDNDGPGSELHADMVDGLHAADITMFANTANGQHLDTFTYTGIFGFYGRPECPFGGGIGILLVLSYSEDWVVQVCWYISSSNLRPKQRMRHSGTTWTGWIDLS